MLVIVPRVLAGAMPSTSVGHSGTRPTDWATLACVLLGILAFGRWANTPESG